MTEMLSDIDKFKKLNVNYLKELHLLLKHGEKLVSFLKGIKKSTEEEFFLTAICLSHSQPWVILEGTASLSQL